MNNVSMVIAQDLDLNVFSTNDSLLDKHLLGWRLIDTTLERIRHLVGMVHHANASTATAITRFEHDGIAESICKSKDLFRGRDGLLCTWNDRYACRFSDLTCRHLITHSSNA